MDRYFPPDSGRFGQGAVSFASKRIQIARKAVFHAYEHNNQLPRMAEESLPINNSSKWLDLHLRL